MMMLRTENSVPHNVVVTQTEHDKIMSSGV